MAIKTVSQLDPFKNGDINNSSATSDGGHGQLGIGKNLTFFADGYLTSKDKQLARAVGGSESSYSSGASKITSSNAAIVIADETYWSSLFEVSQPSTKSSSTNTENAKEYSSYSIQYEDVLKNILWDVKSFLNYRNNLNDYNLSTIVDGD